MGSAPLQLDGLVDDGGEDQTVDERDRHINECDTNLVDRSWTRWHCMLLAESH